MECLRNQFQNGVVLGGRYQTLSPLNHGSFGMVFMARDLESNGTVAIKCLTKKSAADEAGYDFAVDDESEELILHSRLGTHKNIVNLIDSFDTDAHVYLVLEFCANGDLYEAIRGNYGPLETEHVRRFMLELLDAVEYMHYRGVYHRDIKPENIFLTESGAMKLGDFGLATTEKWTFETTVGSDRYMAPEQFDSAGAGYSPAQADIWAIGICLLNILFSKNPFTMPTEADPLFLDFSRDKQSLFDVFPSMSQDTYEVIVQCMNLDPSRRSLAGARRALMRVVSFTTLEEEVDDFCCAEPRTLATANNREPLRTPSIQTPQLDQGDAFPWEKVLHTSPPQPFPSKLNIVANRESYSEDLFARSEDIADWCSAGLQTPSMASTFDSHLASPTVQALAVSRAAKTRARSAAKVSPMAGSLPINMSKARNQSSLPLAFGGRLEAVSKSWSDMWDEEFEEQEEERERQIRALKENNARTFSSQSKAGDETPRQDLEHDLLEALEEEVEEAEPDSTPIHESTANNDVDDDLFADGFFFHDPTPPRKETPPPQWPRYSPPQKRTAVDKWEALGERRRAYTKAPELEQQQQQQSSATIAELNRPGRQVGFGYNNNYSSSFATGVWDQYNHHYARSRDRNRECPRNKGREARDCRDWNWRRERRHDFGHFEWVGGWQEARS